MHGKDAGVRVGVCREQTREKFAFSSEQFVINVVLEVFGRKTVP